jgi:hypothetical protein
MRDKLMLQNYFVNHRIAHSMQGELMKWSGLPGQFCVKVKEIVRDTVQNSVLGQIPHTSTSPPTPNLPLPLARPFSTWMMTSTS